MTSKGINATKRIDATKLKAISITLARLRP
jgi:hypothetical protein